MQIYERKDGIKDVVYLKFMNQPECHLNEDQLRHLMVWVFKNKSVLIQEIVCEECPEHIGEMERKAGVMNECERGHRS